MLPVVLVQFGSVLLLQSGQVIIYSDTCLALPVFFLVVVVLQQYCCLQLWSRGPRSARDPLGFHFSMARPNGLPPGRSQYDGSVAVQTSESVKVNSVPAAQKVEVASRALKEMNNVARADHQRIDLNDLLANSSRDSQYPELPAGVRSPYTCRKLHR